LAHVWIRRRHLGIAPISQRSDLLGYQTNQEHDHGCAPQHAYSAKVEFADADEFPTVPTRRRPPGEAPREQMMHALTKSPARHPSTRCISFWPAMGDRGLDHVPATAPSQFST